MENEMPEHPLARWLGFNNVAAYRWAEEKGIAKTTLYRLMSGQSKGRQPLMDTLIKIEKATGGEVSIGQMVDWHKKLNDPEAEEAPE